MAPLMGFRALSINLDSSKHWRDESPAGMPLFISAADMTGIHLAASAPSRQLAGMPIPKQRIDSLMHRSDIRACSHAVIKIFFVHSKPLFLHILHEGH